METHKTGVLKYETDDETRELKEQQAKLDAKHGIISDPNRHCQLCKDGEKLIKDSNGTIKPVKEMIKESHEIQKLGAKGQEGDRFGEDIQLMIDDSDDAKEEIKSHLADKIETTNENRFREKGERINYSKATRPKQIISMKGMYFILILSLFGNIDGATVTSAKSNGNCSVLYNQTVEKQMGIWNYPPEINCVTYEDTVIKGNLWTESNSSTYTAQTYEITSVDGQTSIRKVISSTNDQVNCVWKKIEHFKIQYVNKWFMSQRGKKWNYCPEDKTDQQNICCTLIQLCYETCVEANNRTYGKTKEGWKMVHQKSGDIECCFPEEESTPTPATTISHNPQPKTQKKCRHGTSPKAKKLCNKEKKQDIIVIAVTATLSTICLIGLVIGIGIAMIKSSKEKKALVLAAHSSNQRTTRNKINRSTTNLCQCGGNQLH